MDKSIQFSYQPSGEQERKMSSRWRFVIIFLIIFFGFWIFIDYLSRRTIDFIQLFIMVVMIAAMIGIQYFFERKTMPKDKSLIYQIDKRGINIIEAGKSKLYLWSSFSNFATFNDVYSNSGGSLLYNENTAMAEMYPEAKFHIYLYDNKPHFFYKQSRLTIKANSINFQQVVDLLSQYLPRHKPKPANKRYATAWKFFVIFIVILIIAVILITIFA